MIDKSVGNTLKWLQSARRITLCVLIAVLIGLAAVFVEIIYLSKIVLHSSTNQVPGINS